MLTIAETFTGLTAPASAAHIHCCGPVGVNEMVAVPFTPFPNATAGAFNTTVDLSLASTYTAGFIAQEGGTAALARSEEHTSELQSHLNLVCRLLLERKKH